MWICRICRFQTELDDTVVITTRGACICLRCYERETGSARPMPAGLRRDLSAALAAPEAA